MKILLVNDWPVESGGGAEIYTSMIHKELIASGHFSYILAGQIRGKNLIQKEDRCYIPFLNFGPLRYNIKEHYLDVKKALLIVNEVIKRFKPDIVHFQNLLNPLILRFLRQRIPSIDTAHDCRPFCSKPPADVASRFVGNTNILCEKVFDKSCFRKCYLGVFNNIHRNKFISFIENVSYFPYNYLALKETLKLKKILCVSEFIKNLAIRCGASQDSLIVLPAFSRFNQNNETNVAKKVRNRVLYASRLTCSKGIYCFLESIKYLPNDFEIEIAGDGPEYNNVVSKCNEYIQKGKKVIVRGFLDELMMKEAIMKCDVVVFPSLWAEGCGLIGIEALGFKKPVIAFEVGGVSEWLIDGVTGVFAKYGDPKDLAKKICQLKNNQKLMNELGDNGQKLVRKKFELKNHISKLIDIYGEIKNQDIIN
jgi:glycosyltransferase involved in cell wall biosynthesis